MYAQPHTVNQLGRGWNFQTEEQIINCLTVYLGKEKGHCVVAQVQALDPYFFFGGG